MVGPTKGSRSGYKRGGSVPASTTQHSKSGTILLHRAYSTGSIHQLRSKETKGYIAGGVYVLGSEGGRRQGEEERNDYGRKQRGGRVDVSYILRHTVWVGVDGNNRPKEEKCQVRPSVNQ